MSRRTVGMWGLVVLGLGGCGASQPAAPKRTQAPAAVTAPASVSAPPSAVTPAPVSTAGSVPKQTGPTANAPTLGATATKPGSKPTPTSPAPVAASASTPAATPAEPVCKPSLFDERKAAQALKALPEVARLQAALPKGRALVIGAGSMLSARLVQGSCFLEVPVYVDHPGRWELWRVFLLDRQHGVRQVMGPDGHFVPR